MSSRPADVALTQSGAAMLEAVSESTFSALNSCVLFLLAHPEFQEIANEKLSWVVGDDRSPTYDDESNLSYITAIGKEILLRRPVTTIGSPHYITSDVYYMDYFIRKDTVVSIAQCVLHFDPNKMGWFRELQPVALPGISSPPWRLRRLR